MVRMKCGLVENCQLADNQASTRSQLLGDCYSWPGTDQAPCDANLHTKMSISTYVSTNLEPILSLALW